MPTQPLHANTGPACQHSPCMPTQPLHANPGMPSEGLVTALTITLPQGLLLWCLGYGKGMRMSGHAQVAMLTCRRATFCRRRSSTCTSHSPRAVMPCWTTSSSPPRATCYPHCPLLMRCFVGNHGVKVLFVLPRPHHLARMMIQPAAHGACLSGACSCTKRALQARLHSACLEHAPAQRLP